MRLPILLLTAALALTACGGDDEPDAAAPSRSGPPADATTTSAPATPSVACLDVPASVVSGLASGAEAAFKPLTLTGGKALKAPDRSEVYFIAAKTTDDPPSVGVWAKSGPLATNEGLILAVSSFAQASTVWPDADESQAGITEQEPGVRDVQGCVE